MRALTGVGTFRRCINPFPSENFRLFQTQRVCRWQFRSWWKCQKILQNDFNGVFLQSRLKSWFSGKRIRFCSAERSNLVLITCSFRSDFSFLPWLIRYRPVIDTCTFMFQYAIITQPTFLRMAVESRGTHCHNTKIWLTKEIMLDLVLETEWFH